MPGHCNRSKGAVLGAFLGEFISNIDDTKDWGKYGDISIIIMHFLSSREKPPSEEMLSRLDSIKLADMLHKWINDIPPDIIAENDGLNCGNHKYTPFISNDVFNRAAAQKNYVQDPASACEYAHNDIISRGGTPESPVIVPVSIILAFLSKQGGISTDEIISLVQTVTWDADSVICAVYMTKFIAELNETGEIPNMEKFISECKKIENNLRAAGNISRTGIIKSLNDILDDNVRIREINAPNAVVSSLYAMLITSAILRIFDENDKIPSFIKIIIKIRDISQKEYIGCNCFISGAIIGAWLGLKGMNIDTVNSLPHKNFVGDTTRRFIQICK